MLIETKIEKDNKLKCVNIKPLTGNDVGPDLKDNVEYEAKEVYTCTCGQKHIDVGLKSNYNWIRCYNCQEELPRGREIHWAHPIRFEIV